MVSNCLKGYFTGIWEIILLAQFRWSNPEGYGGNQQSPEPNKAKEARTRERVLVFKDEHIDTYVAAIS